MTAVEWLAFVVLLVSAAVAAIAVTLSNGAVTGAIQQLERTYRRQKSLELETLQAQAVAQRRAEVEGQLGETGGLERVVNQLLADALPETGAKVGTGGVLEVSANPTSRFTVAGDSGRQYLFTTSIEALREVKVLGRNEEGIALDAALHPAARAEVQAVWERLAAQRLKGRDVPVLPRQAEWFLVVRDRR